MHPSLVDALALQLHTVNLIMVMAKNNKYFEMHEQQEEWVINDNGAYQVYCLPPLTTLPPFMGNQTKNNL